MRTIADIPANKLFILDDFAKDHRGSYYIGESMKFNEERATLALIKHVAELTGSGKKVFCGSSKGGWAALYFGTHFENAYIISGGSQYYLGDYLMHSGNLEALTHILGEITDEGKEYLNHYLENRLRQNGFKDSQQLYLHYSNREHTYFEHIKDMVTELENNRYNVFHDVEAYENHSEISLYFPAFLKKTLFSILQK